MELWIVLGLVAAACAVGAASRLCRRRPRQPAAEETKNIYPLW